MTARELAARSRILAAFARGERRPVEDDAEALRALADAHVVVLAPAPSRVLMAHPFAGHEEGARVVSGGRTWWGNCAWDALGIVAALGLEDADVDDHGVALAVRDGAVLPTDARFHVEVPAAHWWDDIAFT